MPSLWHSLCDITPTSCSLSKPSSNITFVMNFFFFLINRFKEWYLPLNFQCSLFLRHILFYHIVKLFDICPISLRKKAPWGKDPCIIYFVNLRTWQRIYFVNFCWMHGYSGNRYSVDDNSRYLGKQICISFWISLFDFSYIFK